MNAEQLLGDDDEPGDTDAAQGRDRARRQRPDAIFTMLMGEKVAPRKDFIKTEAPEGPDLDV
jgi:DNA gyrase/topoisomerase IV subunit B